MTYRHLFFIVLIVVSIRFVEKTPVFAEENEPLSDDEISCNIVYRSGKENDGHNNIRIPVVCATKKGTLLAFAEGRVAGDTGKIELILRRSFDNGATWGEVQIVWKDNGNTCGNPAPVCDEETGTLWLFATWNDGRDHEGNIMNGTSRKPRIPYMMKSDDDGETWSEPKPLPHLRKNDWGWYATGPCNGIQLKNGPHKGRLVIPANHSIIDEKIQKNERYRSHIVFSDDHGKTWQLGGINEPLTNESTVLELENGSVMQNMRSYHGQNSRAVSISRDGGKNFPASGIGTGTPAEDAYLDRSLHSPVCQGSILRFGGNTILYSGPWGKGRSKLSVWISKDDARTWSKRLTIHDGPAAYSNLVMLPGEKVGLLAETGFRSPYERISFFIFPITLLEK